jgi:hypothetical protein
LAGDRPFLQYGGQWPLKLQTNKCRLGTSSGDREGITGQYSVSFRPYLSQPAFQVPHRVQQAMSAEDMPVLSSAVAIFELFMSEWEELRKDYPRLTPWIDVGLHWAQKYYKSMDDTDAYIVTMGGLF